MASRVSLQLMESTTAYGMRKGQIRWEEREKSASERERRRDAEGDTSRVTDRERGKERETLPY